MAISRQATVGGPTSVCEISGGSRFDSPSERARLPTMSTSFPLSIPPLVGVGYWTWDVAEGRVRWDPTLERLYGLEPGSFGGAFEDWAALVHPDDRQTVIDIVQRAMATASVRPRWPGKKPSTITIFRMRRFGWW